MMKWLFPKRTVREKEIRRTKAERGLTWAAWLPGQFSWPVVLGTVAVALIVAVVVNVGQPPLRFRVGELTDRPLAARVEFNVPNPTRTQLLRSRARESASYYYRLDESLLNDIRGRLVNAFRPVGDALPSPAELRRVAAPLGVKFDDSAVQFLEAMPLQSAFTQYEGWVDQAVETLRRTPLVEPADTSRPRTALYAVLTDPQNPAGRREPVTQLIRPDMSEEIQRALSMVANRFPEPLRPSMVSTLTGLLKAESGETRPLYRYDAVRSEVEAKAAEDAVAPEFDNYPSGVTLADRGIITAGERELLRVEHAAVLSADQRSPWRLSTQGWAMLGRGLLAVAVVLGLIAYFVWFRSYRTFRGTRAWITGVVLFTMLVASRLVYVALGTSIYTIGAQAFAVGILAVLGPRDLQAALAGALALLLTLATDARIETLFGLLAVTGVMLVGLKQVRNRGRVVFVGLMAALVVALVSMVIGLYAGQPILFVLQKYVIPSAAATLAAAFVVEGLLPGIERFFKVSTNMTLLEWLDANKPLMRMMAGEAPGTYNHSLLVGSLAEAAGEAIGLNGLLLRAGAYYHDIGKINKPEYFVENQEMGVSSRHDKLTPAMSHLVIINHVKDGLAMAREYGVPEVLHPFIAEHHGTTVVEYFFHAASKQRKPDDPEISDAAFRYPGPKPQSRETAVLMLCDAVEGAVRAMPEPTPARIEEVVARIAEKRLLDGQFDECELTFRDLARVQRAIVKALNSIYHARIVYPENEEKSRTGAEVPKPGESSIGVPATAARTAAPRPAPRGAAT